MFLYFCEELLYHNNYFVTMLFLGLAVDRSAAGQFVCAAAGQCAHHPRGCPGRQRAPCSQVPRGRGKTAFSHAGRIVIMTHIFPKS